jgi:hypothetical protein
MVWASAVIASGRCPHTSKRPASYWMVTSSEATPVNSACTTTASAVSNTFTAGRHSTAAVGASVMEDKVAARASSTWAMKRSISLAHCATFAGMHPNCRPWRTTPRYPVPARGAYTLRQTNGGLAGLRSRSVIRHRYGHALLMPGVPHLAGPQSLPFGRSTVQPPAPRCPAAGRAVCHRVDSV